MDYFRIQVFIMEGDLIDTIGTAFHGVDWGCWGYIMVCISRTGIWDSEMAGIDQRHHDTISIHTSRLLVW